MCRHRSARAFLRVGLSGGAAQRARRFQHTARAQDAATAVLASALPNDINDTRNKAWEDKAPTAPLLTRDFIAKSLYNQDTGYFSTKDVINDLPGPLEFGSMVGEMHYRMDVKQAYESKLSAWMTPVETFSPHYSHALARYIAREAKAAARPARNRASPAARKTHGTQKGATHSVGAEPLVLYEAGGGTGTNALNVLNWLRREEPKLYERTEYTIVEISERLAERQKERVCAVHENCRVVNANVLEWGMSGEADPRPCFFLGMELLDNLPHDKIAWTTPSLGPNGDALSPPADSSNKEMCEAVVLQTSSSFREAFRPLRDPAIRELLTLCPELAEMVRKPGQPTTGAGGDGGNFLGKTLAGLFGSVVRPEYHAAFVPTGAFRLFQALHRRLPRHRAILADFDSFAGSGETRAECPCGDAAAVGGGRGNDESLMAFQAPIVSSRNPETGVVVDHATYMVDLGTADIFFPTSFKRLSRLHAAVCGTGGVGVRRGAGLVVKQAEFLREFADLRATRTFSGFNPLVDDFRNSSVFVSGALVA